MPDRDAALSAIAARVLRIETLDTRKSDSLDFHEVAVWGLKQALEEAYAAGRASAAGAKPGNAQAPQDMQVQEDGLLSVMQEASLRAVLRRLSGVPLAFAPLEDADPMYRSSEAVAAAIGAVLSIDVARPNAAAPHHLRVSTGTAADNRLARLQRAPILEFAVSGAGVDGYIGGGTTACHVANADLAAWIKTLVDRAVAADGVAFNVPASPLA